MISDYEFKQLYFKINNSNRKYFRKFFLFLKNEGCYYEFLTNFKYTWSSECYASNIDYFQTCSKIDFILRAFDWETSSMSRLGLLSKKYLFWHTLSKKWRLIVQDIDLKKHN